MTADVARARPLEGSSAHVRQSGAQSAGKMAPPMRTHASRGVGEYEFGEWNVSGVDGDFFKKIFWRT